MGGITKGSTSHHGGGASKSAIIQLTEEEKELLQLGGDFNPTEIKGKNAPAGEDSSGSGQLSPGGSTLTGKRKRR